MCPTEYQDAKDRLLQLRDELESVAAIGDASAAVVELDQSKVGRLSRMDAMQAQEMAKASGQRRVEMTQKINAALSRINNGDYGNCKNCDLEINPKRLEVDPTAELCIACASLSEKV